MQISYPFGPPISIGSLAKPIIKPFNDYCELIESQDYNQKYDHSKRLVGKISKEISFERGVLDDVVHQKCLNALELCVLGFLAEAYRHRGISIGNNITNDSMIEEWDIWVNRQYANEYNPVHYHSRYDVSGVLYLKVPKIIQKEKGFRDKTRRDGLLEFIFGSPTPFSESRFTVRPRKGLILIFPSSLLHTVYPFPKIVNDIEERRSLAFNVKLKSQF